MPSVPRVSIDAIYSELRALTAQNLEQSEPVRPAALVHQAWSRLGGSDAHAASERTRCLSIGAIAVRQILAAEPGSRHRVELGDAIALSSHEVRVADLDALLARLEQEDQLQARIAQLRVFGNLSVEEAADALEVPHADGHAAWARAGDRLARELGGSRSA